MRWIIALFSFITLSIGASAQNIAPGNTFIGNTNGNPPATSVGSEASWFLDVGSGKVYGPKSFGVWSATPAATLTNLTADATVTGNWTFANPINIGSAAAQQYKFGTRLNVASFPVPNVTPTQANTVIAFDVLPNGTPAEFGNNGFAWIDVCDGDFNANASVASTCARVGVTSTGVKFGSRQNNGATIIPIIFEIGQNGSTLFEAARFDTTGFFGLGSGASPASRLTVADGTVTTSRPIETLTQTWNAGGVTFTGALTNITDTASAAASLIEDWQVGAASKMSISKSGNLVLAGGVTSVGVTDASSAAAGKVGEVISSTVLVGSAVSLSNGVAATITSISLTAGDWDCKAAGLTNPAAGTIQADSALAINTTTNALGTPGIGYVRSPYAAAASTPVAMATSKRVNISATTTYYMVMYSVFSVSTNAAYGTLECRRMR